MRQTHFESLNYSSDLSGICSALYELGGLIVMHDASGCNSTYASHDEPRWYDIDSMIYISALTEYDAILGNDETYIQDIIEVAEARHPKFICVFGSPVALVTGTDFKGIARLVEKRTGIPTMAFQTTGTQTYLQGGRQAFLQLAQRFCPKDLDREQGGPDQADRPTRVNLLGVTPLDFSVNENIEGLHNFLTRHGMEEVSCWAMGDSLEKLTGAGRADVNLVVSSLGLDLAKFFKELYGQAYVVGIPMGEAGDRDLARMIKEAGRDGKDRLLWGQSPRADHLPAQKDEVLAKKARMSQGPGQQVLLLGETVFAGSLRYLLEEDLGQDQVTVVCPLEDSFGLLRPGDLLTGEEEDIKCLANASHVFIADPAWAQVLDPDWAGDLVPIPQEAYSGRAFRPEIPVFVDPSFQSWPAFAPFLQD